MARVNHVRLEDDDMRAQEDYNSLFYELDSDTEDKAEAKPTEPGDCLRKGLQRSLAKLDAASHAIQLRQAALEQHDKQTARTYSLAVSSYEMWWGQYKMQLHAEDLLWTTIPTIPIMVAKVAMFLPMHLVTAQERK